MFRCGVHLLNGEKLYVDVSAKQRVEQLESRLAEHLGIRNEQERQQIFALAHIEEGKYLHWLLPTSQFDELAIPMAKKSPIVNGVAGLSRAKFELHFLIKHMPRSIIWLHDPVIILLFFHQARLQFLKGQIHLPHKEYIHCAACLILLIAKSEESMGETKIVKNKILEIFHHQIGTPSMLQLRHLGCSLMELEELLLEECQQMQLQNLGQGPIQLIMDFLCLCESSQLFCCAFYPVHDQHGTPWTLALNGHSIQQLDPKDPFQPKKVWKWTSLTNFYRKGECQLVLEVNDSGSGYYDKNSSTQFSSIIPTSSSSSISSSSKCRPSPPPRPPHPPNPNHHLHPHGHLHHFHPLPTSALCQSTQSSSTGGGTPLPSSPPPSSSSITTQSSSSLPSRMTSNEASTSSKKYSPSPLYSSSALTKSFGPKKFVVSFLCQSARLCNSLWHFCVAQHRWTLDNQKMQQQMTMNSTHFVRRRQQLISRLHKYFIGSAAEEDSISLANLSTASASSEHWQKSIDSFGVGTFLSNSSLETLSLKSASAIVVNGTFQKQPLVRPFGSHWSLPPSLSASKFWMPAARVADRSPAAPSPHNSLSQSAMTKTSLLSMGIGQQQSPLARPHESQSMERRQTEEAEDGKEEEAIANQNPPMIIADISVKTEEELQREREHCKMLVEQKERLEEQLVQRIEELKRLCIAEGELTGQLPKEIYKTLLPGEPEPQIKMRVGTTFKFPELLIQQRQNNEGDDCSRLEAEIELNRRIVAAAERLANDRSANKSVRKKRRKDLQVATLRLRGLEKGLNRMRLSCSKQDVSSLTDGGASSTSMAKSAAHAGSGFSLNSLMHWPNFYNSFRNTTKSCPSTPRGSVPDLTASTVISTAPTKPNVPSGAGGGRRPTPTATKKLYNLLKSQKEQLQQQHQQNGHPSSTIMPDSASIGGCQCHHSSSSGSSLSLSLNSNPSGGSPKITNANGRTTILSSATTSTSSGISSANGAIPLSSAASSSTNLLLCAPPPVPMRRSSAGNVGISVRRPTPPRQRRSASRDRGGRNQCNDDYNYDYYDEEGTEGMVLYDGREEQFSPTHLYANIGYTSSAPYKSAYRQCNFPTLQSPNRSPQNANANGISSASSTSFSANKPIPVYVDGLPAGQRRQNRQTLNEAASNQLGQIVKQLDSVVGLNTNSSTSSVSSSSSLICRQIPVQFQSSLSASAIPRPQLRLAIPKMASSSSSFSTTSLDRRGLNKSVNQKTHSTNGSRFANAIDHPLQPRRESPLANANGSSPPIPKPRHSPPQQQSTTTTTTTFPVTQTFRPLEASDFARFRSISAVLDHQKKVNGQQRQHQQIPPKDDRMEALLASIHHHHSSSSSSSRNSSPAPPNRAHQPQNSVASKSATTLV